MPSRIRILVVEASQDVRTLIADVLTAEGHEIASRWPRLASRLICVTGGTNAGAINHATLRAASVPFMVKPFVPSQLRDLVRRRLAELGALPRTLDRSEPPDA